jgi:hypothetical protein
VREMWVGRFCFKSGRCSLRRGVLISSCGAGCYSGERGKVQRLVDIILSAGMWGFFVPLPFGAGEGVLVVVVGARRWLAGGRFSGS